MRRILCSGSSIGRPLWSGDSASKSASEIFKLRVWATASFSSSSDEKNPPDQRQPNQDDDEARSEYRTWVESMLTSQQAEPAVREEVVRKAQDEGIAGRSKSRAGSGGALQSDIPEKELDKLPTEAVPEETVQRLAKIAAEGPSLASQPENVAPSPDAAEKLKGALDAFPEPRDGPVSHPLEEAAAPKPGSPTNIPEASGQAAAVSPTPGPPQVPRRLTVREPEAVLPDAVLGYRELGTSDSSERDAVLLDEGQGRISRRRIFWPSAIYKPEDLAPTTPESIASTSTRRDTRLKVKKASNSEALREADFRNVSFLHKFTSEAGALPSRRVTKLKKKVHVHVMKQIKLARQMALLPPEGKIEELMPRQR